MFWRRVEDAPDGHIEAAGAVDLSVGEAATPRSRHHPFSDQPDPAADRRDPRLWRRLLFDTAQRMGMRRR